MLRCELAMDTGLLATSVPESVASPTSPTCGCAMSLSFSSNNRIIISIHFKYQPLSPKNLTPFSSVFTAEASSVLSLFGDPLGARSDPQAIPSPARSPPTAMSSSASPSAAPSAEYAEHLSNLVAIPSLSHENYYFLGPVGNPDPTEFIIGETNRIPFRLANPDLANSAKDEPLMASASYFWSNTINAFLFNQVPMTPTLIDITMITGLDVTSSANPMSPNTKNQYDFRTKSIEVYNYTHKTQPHDTFPCADMPPRHTGKRP
ncbi:aminotransferase-like protein [Oryza sativa Japonica Group]|uniref:Aminotransferase-like protein n=1 Tax=Oryza sativa subsp. japonica TaxID=39947 RepID=Q94IX6_ORYSJ|nr:aminotransferase-like protein [Oryza sativa Japonica Group]